MPVSIDRRLLLRRAALLGASLPLVKLIGPARGQSSELIARRVFFDNPDYINVRLSPDGTQLSYVAPLDGVNNLWVAPLSDLKAARPVTRVTDRNISAGYRWAHTNRHVVFFRERDGDENWRAASVDITDGKIVPLTPETGVKAFLQESDRKFPEEMLLRHNQRDKRYFDLYRANVVTGTSELVYENHDYVGLITDSAFQLRLASRLIADGSAEVFERRPDGSWAPFMTVPIADTDTTQMLDFSADGKTLYLIDSRGRDKAALFALDMATRQTTLLAADDDADIVRAIFDENRRPLAALAITDRMRWHTVDQSVARDLADLGRYGAGDISFVSNSDDLQLGTVHFERDTESGEYALLDRRTREVRKLFTQRRALDGVALRKLEPVVIPSRDGLRLNCYLTRPVEAEAGRVPLVLVIHGGPYYRDSWGFSPVHQWLASRGYAVLAVNYRGSTGFGKAFVTAADHEWGGKMHDDLIDAVDWAIAQGIADPKRVGFFGGSYGGYSALMAATKTPDVFACIVDLFGISNLVTFMATIPPYWGPWNQCLEKPAWRSRHRGRPRIPGRTFAADPHRPCHQADPDRPGPARCQGCGCRVRADGQCAQAARNTRDLRHIR